MGDLRQNNARMQEFVRHIQGREGSRSRFYLDANNLVTIGVGHLVDARGSRAAREQVGRAFANAHHHFFQRQNGAAVNANAVFQDWLHVLDGGAAHLRISQQGINTLLRQRLGGFIATLYQRRPFVLVLNERIHMALIDARFNPAGVALYGSAGQIGRMWDSLNPRTRSFNLRDALRYFELAWRGRGGHLRARYQERHRLRIGMFRRGIEHMEYCLRRPTAAVRAKRYPAYPAANAGIIGVYRSETDAVNEKATDRAWRARAEWECWIQKRSRAIGTYIYDNTIVGIYQSAQDARHDGVETLEITRATETAAVQRAMAQFGQMVGGSKQYLYAP